MLICVRWLTLEVGQRLPLVLQLLFQCLLRENSDPYGTEQTGIESASACQGQRVNETDCASRITVPLH
jgi:hypothetical protein